MDTVSKQIVGNQWGPNCFNNGLISNQKTKSIIAESIVKNILVIHIWLPKITNLYCPKIQKVQTTICTEGNLRQKKCVCQQGCTSKTIITQSLYIGGTKSCNECICYKKIVISYLTHLVVTQSIGQIKQNNITGFTYLINAM